MRQRRDRDRFGHGHLIRGMCKVVREIGYTPCGWIMVLDTMHDIILLNMYHTQPTYLTQPALLPFEHHIFSRP